MAEGLELGTAINLGAFVQVFRDFLEETMQHPERKRLVDRHQHNYRCGQMTP